MADFSTVAFRLWTLRSLWGHLLPELWCRQTGEVLLAEEHSRAAPVLLRPLQFRPVREAWEFCLVGCFCLLFALFCFYPRQFLCIFVHLGTHSLDQVGLKEIHLLLLGLNVCTTT